MVNIIFRQLFCFFAVIIFTSCGSEISVKSLSDRSENIVGPGNPIPLVKNNIEITGDSISNISASGFEITLNYDGDDNNNASAALVFCNETDNPGCNPNSGTTVNFVDNGDGTMTAVVSGLVAPNDLGDDLNYRIIVTDADGVVNAPTPAMMTLNELRPIFRSMGASNTSSLALGAANALTISGSVATFANPISNIIGVGDALQYDSDNNGSIDSVIFIHGRTDAQNYTVADVNGAPVADLVTPDNDWTIYRAYTSLSNAENGIENTALDDAIENFDTWSGGHDLVVGNNSWNIALYADGGETITGSLNVEGWTTGPSNTFRIFTPSKITEVGISQRHFGKLDLNKHYLLVNASADFARGLRLRDQNIIVDGMQIIVRNNGNNSVSGLYVDGAFITNAFRHEYKNNLIIGQLTTVPGQGINIALSSDSNAEFRLSHNIAANFPRLNSSDSYGFHLRFANVYAYNNTAINCTSGFRGLSRTVMKNNLLINSRYYTPFSTVSANNVSDSAETTGALTDQTNRTLGLNAPEVHDYRLSGQAYAAIGTGLDLSNDSDYPITEDIQGNTISTWNVGAQTETATAIFRSVAHGSFGSLKNGNPGTITVALNADGHTQATFANALADNIGVGDAIEYDSDGTPGVDTIAFISQRIDSQNYIIKNSSGLNAALTSSPNTTWDIFRAYTSLTGAEAGTNENANINGALQDFDTWQSTSGTPHDLVSTNQNWNLVLYADNPFTTSATFEDWTLSSLNRLNIISAHESYEVGNSQRHRGVYDNKKVLIDGNPIVLRVTDSKVKGLQIFDGNSCVSFTGAANGLSGEILFSHNICRGELGVAVLRSAYDGGNGVEASGISHKIWNNVFYDWDQNSNGLYLAGSAINHIFNNTFVNIGFRGIGSNGANNIVNNINYSNSSGFNYGGGVGSQTSHNLSGPTRTDAPGVNSVQGASPLFLGNTADNFELNPADGTALDVGTDLSYDLNLSVQDDIRGFSRNTLIDIGAFESIGSSDDAISLNNFRLDIVGTDGFQTLLNFTGDNNDNATVTLFYCNNTDAPGCDPEAGSSIAFTDNTTYFSTNLSGLSAPNDPGDILNIRAVATDPDGVYGGPIDLQVRLYNNPGLQSNASLIAAWSFDAGSGFILDETGSGYDAYPENGPTYGATGVQGSAITLTSGTDRFRVDELGNPDELDFGYNDEITMMGWIYPTDLTGFKIFMIKGLSDGTNWFGADNDQLYFGYKDQATDNHIYTTDNSVLQLNQWQHVAVTYRFGDPGSTRIYVNGSLESGSWTLRTGDAVPLANDNSLYLGYYPSEGFVGSMDEWSLWGRIIDGSVISNVYNNQKIPVTDIYRSIGGGNTSSLANGSGNDMTISGGVASFASSLPDNIGVGDAIQYDSDNNGSIDAIIFIQSRTNSQTYAVANADGSAVNDMVVADQDWDIFRAYTSLINAENGTENTGIDAAVVNFDTWSGSRDLSINAEAWHFAIYADAPIANDNFGVTGWNTSLERYMRFFVPSETTEVGISQRHEGYLDRSKAHFVISTDSAFEISEEHVRIEGLQIISDGFVISESPIEIGNPSGLSAFARIYIENNLFILTDHIASNNRAAIYVYPANDDNTEVYIINNTIKWGETAGTECIIAEAGRTFAYNNTLVRCYNGIVSEGSNTVIKAMNNIAAYSGSDSYRTVSSGAFDVGSNNNMSSDISNTGGGNDQVNTTVYFKGEHKYDFRLSGRSLAAIGAGADLSADIDYSFNTDINGNTRTRWDMGANNINTRIYRSVGPSNTVALQAGTGNAMTIVNGVATFTLAVADNIGVGDAIQYDRDNDGTIDDVMFITRRNTNQMYNVQNADGSIPADMAVGDQDWEVYRAYTSLANAENGTENTGLADAIENFDIWSGGRDLVTNQEEWEIALYDDAVDTDPVYINGWSTSSEYDLTIKTPVDTSEVGVTQRHYGAWGRGYRIRTVNNNITGVLLSTDSGHFTFEGLQLSMLDSFANYSVSYLCFTGCNSGTSDMTFRENIVRGETPTGLSMYGLVLGQTSDLNENKFYAFNNIIYGLDEASYLDIGIRTNNNFSENYIINNTITLSDHALRRDSGNIYAVNNIGMDSLTQDFADFGGNGSYLDFINNLSSDNSASLLGGTGNIANDSPAFRAYNDMRLASSNVFGGAAKNAGFDMRTYAHVDIRSDIEGNQRTNGVFDIGAHEAADFFIRSIGEGYTTALASGSSNDLTISSGIASFTSDMPSKVGVGDVIQYDSDNNGTIDAIMIITLRNSDNNFTVTTATGSTPADMAIVDNDWSAYRAYTSFSDAMTGIENTALDDAIENFDTHNSTHNLKDNHREWAFALYADNIFTNNLVIDNWVTSSTRNLNFFAPAYQFEVGSRQQHEGLWNDQFVSIQPTTNNDAIDINIPFVSITGLQIAATTSNNILRYGIEIDGGLVGGIDIANNIIRDPNPAGGAGRAGIYQTASTTGYPRFANNVIYGFNGTAGVGLQLEGNHKAFVGNNTIYGNGDGLRCVSGNCECYNNLISNSGGDDYFNGDSCDLVNSANNLASDTTAHGPGAIDSGVVIFENEANFDLRLSPQDTTAKDAGADITSLGMVTDNVGHFRIAEGQVIPMDIGAFEAATILYRSIGPGNTTALAVGTGNDMNFASSVANFASVVADNIGVGDVIEYDSDGNASIDAVAFIHARTDSQTFTIADEFGAPVADLANTQNWNIFRAYTSLNDLNNTTENTGLDDFVEDFDDNQLLELYNSNTRLNLALYADGAHGRWVVSSSTAWETEYSNTVRLFSPDQASEVGVSQRHQGFWSDTKSRMVDNQVGGIIYINGYSTTLERMNYLEVDGIQIENGYSGVSASHGFYLDGINTSANFIIKNNLIRRTNEFDSAGIFGSISHGQVRVINNIIYDFAQGLNIGNANLTSIGSRFYIYNNTVADTTANSIQFSAYGNNDHLRMINNIASGAGSDYIFTSTFESLVRENNISADTTAIGTGSQTNTNVSFMNQTGKDYRLALGEADATNNGSDLSADPIFPFNQDAIGRTRAQWDIGAFAYFDYSVGATEFDEYGEGTAGNPYQLFNKEQIKDIGADATNGCNASTGNACSSSFVLNNDININNEAYTPIGDSTNRFTGNFNCNNKTISNLTINSPGTDLLGLFGRTDSPAVIQDCNLDTFNITGKDNIGGLAGRSATSTISNITATNFSINGEDYIGGIIGYVDTSTLTNISIDGTITGTAIYAGGITAYGNNADITNSTSLADVNGQHYVGGVIGHAAGNGSNILSGLVSKGDVTGTGNRTGGLIGYCWHSIADSYSTGTVRGSGLYVGGLVGQFSDDSVDSETISNSYSLSDVFNNGHQTGGLVGYAANANVSINTSWAAGDVKTNGDYVGGLVGNSIVTIADSHALGNVESTGEFVGGFVGLSSSGNIIRAFATGQVSVSAGPGSVGGFAGRSAPNLTDVWASGNVYSSVTNVGGLVGYKSGGTILRSFATGNVFSSATNTGGLVGYNAGNVTESYATGDTIGATSTGGLIGESGAGTILNSYTTGYTYGSSNVGGMMGSMLGGALTNTYVYGNAECSSGTNCNAIIGFPFGGTLTENFWNSDNASEPDGIEGTTSTVNQYEPLTTNQFLDDANFDSGQSGAWDYVNTWAHLDGRAAPVLRTHPEGYCAANPTETSYNATGSGALNNPFIICNSTQFNDFATNGCGNGNFGDCDKKLVQGADIDFKSSNMTHEVGMGSTNDFRGIYDGRNHEIRNYFNNDNANTEGLFAEASGDIRNIKLINSIMSGTNDDAGLVVGQSRGSNLHNITSIGYMNSESVGLIGDVSNINERRTTTIVNTKAYGDLIATTDGAGGIITNGSDDTFVYKSSFAGAIQSNDFEVGGVAGYNVNFIKKSKSMGTITQSSGGRVGGIYGSNNGVGTTIKQVYSSMDINAGGAQVGGLWGSASNGQDVKVIEDSYSANATLDGGGAGEVAGIIGVRGDIHRTYASNDIQNAAPVFSGIRSTSSGAESYNYWDTSISSILNGIGNSGDIVGGAEGRITNQLDNAANFVTWDFTDIWAVGEDVRAPMLRWDLHPNCQANMTATTFDALGNAGTPADPHQICFKEQLMDIATNATSGCRNGAASPTACTESFILMNDIDLKGETFTPIGGTLNSFQGSFDGNGHTITNLRVDNGLAMFAYANTGHKIQNLRIALALVTNTINGGYVGILGGYMTGGFVKNVHVSGSINTDGVSQVGGLIGFTTSDIEDSSAYINITAANGDEVGGLVGSMFTGASILRGQAYGSVTVTGTQVEIGGFVGQTTGGNIADSIAVVGVDAADSSNVGGFIGDAQFSAIITRSYSRGDVIAATNSVGGFVGELQDATVTNSYTRCDLNASGTGRGGFVGLTSNASGTLTDNWSEVTSATADGGFVGTDTLGTYSGNYWNNDLISDANSAGEYEGLTFGQMSLQGSYVGWDFNNTWRLLSGGRPEIIPTTN